MIDPRFPGGTSSAFASELKAVRELDIPVTVHAVSSRMFKGREIAPVLQDTMQKARLTLNWDPEVVSADRVVLQNPAFLKFDDSFGPRILARDLIVVTHENFLRPGGGLSFDVASCLDLIDRNSLAIRKWLSPISASNRRTVLDWKSRSPGHDHWSVLDTDWFNICDFALEPPVARPRDRRGRHSRAGNEKFPTLADLDACFPATAEVNVLLGADNFLADGLRRRHWQMVPFRGMPVSRFFETIDFHVYFTSPTWRESFGRVLAEAMAAGKVVITDPATAVTFKGGAVSCQPSEVNEAVGHFIRHPCKYREQVTRSQQVLQEFTADRFRQMFQRMAGVPAEDAA